MRLLPLLLICAVLIGCDTPPPPAPTPAPLAPTPTSALAACPVTIPNGNVPPPVPNADPVPVPCPECLGNGSLWTTYAADGEIQVSPDNAGDLAAKFGWWRGPGITDDLTISGRRLDGSAPPLRAIIPHGYEGGGFQASGIIFPMPGCWEITGTAGTARLTFVVHVVRVGAAASQ